MSYPLKPGRPVSNELSRIVATEFDKALEALGGSTAAGRAEAVHEARRNIKKIRAILRLLQQDLGKDYTREHQRLQLAGHRLSVLRDVDAMAETMKSVRDRYPRLVTPSIFATIDRGLLARKRREIGRRAKERVLRQALRDLKQSSKRVARQIRRAASPASLREGMTRGYRRARKTMSAVVGCSEDVRFHTWRRRVKDHWYHMRLLEGLRRQARPRVRRLKRLETWLGDEHNLVLLKTTILELPARFAGDRATAVVLGCAAKYQSELRDRSLTAGAHLFARSPRAFRASIEKWVR